MNLLVGAIQIKNSPDSTSSHIILTIILNYLQRMPNSIDLERQDGAVFWGLGSQMSRAVADVEAGGSVLAFLQAALQVASLDLSTERMNSPNGWSRSKW